MCQKESIRAFDFGFGFGVAEDWRMLRVNYKAIKKSI